MGSSPTRAPDPGGRTVSFASSSPWTRPGPISAAGDRQSDFQSVIPETQALGAAMNIFGHDWTFWVALFGAAIVRVITSPFHSILRAATQIFVSVFVAWAFAPAAIDFLHLTPSYLVPIGALLALTA